MYRILVDSCGELFPEMQGDSRFMSIPLTLEVDGHEITDDDSFDQADFLRRVRESPTSPKSACPSPDAYMQGMTGPEEHVYVVTLSAKLSGSYNSACLAKELVEEDLEDEEDSAKEIHVFDSKSASVGETLIAEKIAACEDAGMSFEEVVQETDRFIEEEHTFFILETLETLRKAGRLSGLKAMLANTLNIKPVMGSTPEGSIQQLGQARGMLRALDRMVESMLSVTGNPAERTAAIAHCNCPETAEKLREKLEAKGPFRRIVVVDTHGVSSMYANDGGIILVV